MWFYNISSGQCEQFVYGGCQGNSNRFLTENQCYLSCGKDVHRHVGFFKEQMIIENWQFIWKWVTASKTTPSLKNIICFMAQICVRQDRFLIKMFKWLIYIHYLICLRLNSLSCLKVVCLPGVWKVQGSVTGCMRHTKDFKNW